MEILRGRNTISSKRHPFRLVSFFFIFKYAERCELANIRVYQRSFQPLVDFTVCLELRHAQNIKVKWTEFVHIVVRRRGRMMKISFANLLAK